MSTTYVYKVRDKIGTVHKGSIEGQSEQLVVAKLRELGYVPVSVVARGKSKLSADVSVRSDEGKINLNQLAQLCGADWGLYKTTSINLKRVEEIVSEANVNLAESERGLIKKSKHDVVVLGNGDVTKALTISAHRFTKSAREKIERAGGTATIIG